jgi:hypothetical protein
MDALDGMRVSVAFCSVSVVVGNPSMSAQSEFLAHNFDLAIMTLKSERGNRAAENLSSSLS